MTCGDRPTREGEAPAEPLLRSQIKRRLGRSLALPLALVIVLIPTIARSVEPEVKPEDLPRIKPTEPTDAVKTFKVRPGFHIELVAAEPLVIDPIAMCFDEA